MTTAEITFKCECDDWAIIAWRGATFLAAWAITSDPASPDQAERGELIAGRWSDEAEESLSAGERESLRHALASFEVN